MLTFSVILVFCAIWRTNLAQNGYNYERPDLDIGSGSTSRPTFGVTGSGAYPSPSGFGSIAGATTPAYQIATSGYPTGRPTGSSFSQPSATGYPGSQLGVSGPGVGGYQSVPNDFTGPGSFSSGSSGGIGRPGASNTSPPQTAPGSNFIGAALGSTKSTDNESGDYSAIPGEPGVDYPIYSSIPKTSFDCNQQQYPGYYADIEAQCQVFHICALNKTFDFLCPNGTIFSQEHFVCVWWNQFDCGNAVALFNKNANLYDNSQSNRLSPEAGLFPDTQKVTGPEAIPNQYATRPQSTRPTSASAGYPGGSFIGYPSGPAIGYPSANRPTELQIDGQFASSPQTPIREYLPPRQG